MRRYTAQGHRMHAAPYGLRNVRDIAGNSSLEPMPDVADIVAHLLTEFANGVTNIKQLLALTNQAGLKRSNNKPMTYQLIGKMLRNPIYAGYECSKLTDNRPIKSSLEGISYDLTEQKFGTANMGALYRLASIQKGAVAPNVSSVVTLPLSIYKSVVAEIVRWNELLNGIDWNTRYLQTS